MDTKTHLLLLNPKAGGGRGLNLVPTIETLYREERLAYQLVVTQAPGHATELARTEARRFGALIAVGGDGTVHEVVNGLADAAQESGGPASIAALGILPLGTGNDFLKSLEIPNQLEAAFKVVAQGLRCRIDLGRTGPILKPGPESQVLQHEWFVNDLSVGFGAQVARDMVQPSRLLKALPGRLAYTLAGLRRGLAAARPTRIRLDGRELNAPHFEVHIGNGRYCGGGAQFTPHAGLDDGLLDLTRLHSVSRVRNFLTMLLHLQPGTLKPGQGIDFEKGRSFEIEQDDAFALYLDGDWRQSLPAQPGARARLQVEAVPAALEVLSL